MKAFLLWTIPLTTEGKPKVIFELLSMPYGKKKTRSFIFRTSSSKFLNFLAMFVGFVLASIVLLMLIGSLFRQKSAATAPEQTTEQDKIETESEIATSTSFDLASRLSTMASSEKADSLPVQVDQLRQRIKIANQLLLLENTESQKELAVLAKIDSLTGLLDLAVRNQFTFSNEQQELNSTCEKYQMDRNERIRTRIQLTQFRLNGLSVAKKTESDSKDYFPLVNKIKPLLQMELSQDEQKHLWKSFESFSEINKPFGQDLESAIFKDSSIKKLNAIGRDLRDRAKLVEYDLVGNALGVMNDLPEAREKTFEAARLIASDPLGGERIIKELVSILDWIEQIQELDVAKESFNLLIDSAPERATTDLTKTAIQLGKDGLRRCELVGKTFDFEGIEVHNGNWAHESSNQWTLILFTKPEDSAFSDVVIQSGVKVLIELGFKVLVVNLPERPAGLEITGEELCVKSESVPMILAQYPVRLMPQAILINPKGRVVRTAIPMRSLSSDVQKAKEDDAKRDEESNTED